MLPTSKGKTNTITQTQNEKTPISVGNSFPAEEGQDGPVSFIRLPDKFRDFQDGSHLGYPIRTILATFNLQLTSILQIKFSLYWPFG